MHLIHYGNYDFDDQKFEEVKNREWMKPKGGLWTSPITSKWGWKDWCNAENFRECNISNSFEVKLNENAKILIINSCYDLDKILKISFKLDLIGRKILDYEKLAQQYDAIHLTENGQRKTRYSINNLYGWDCETVFIMNKNCFKII